MLLKQISLNSSSVKKTPTYGGSHRISGGTQSGAPGGFESRILSQYQVARVGTLAAILPFQNSSHGLKRILHGLKRRAPPVAATVMTGMAWFCPCLWARSILVHCCCYLVWCDGSGGFPVVDFCQFIL